MAAGSLVHQGLPGHGVGVIVPQVVLNGRTLIHLQHPSRGGDAMSLGALSGGGNRLLLAARSAEKVSARYLARQSYVARSCEHGLVEHGLGNWAHELPGRLKQEGVVRMKRGAGGRGRRPRGRVPGLLQRSHVHAAGDAHQASALWQESPGLLGESGCKSRAAECLNQYSSLTPGRGKAPETNEEGNSSAEALIGIASRSELWISADHSVRVRQGPPLWW